MKVDVLVVGAGAAGMAAAKAASENGARVWLVEREERIGGVLDQCIHNGFGLHYFKEELTGPEYAHRLFEMLPDNVEIRTDTFVHKVLPDRKVVLVSERGYEEIEVGALVLATGARERPFGSLLIPGDRVSGIFVAGLAQRFVNVENRLPGKRALILGSGDIGLIMARRLTLEGMEVVAVVERLPYPGGLLRNVRQCLEDFNIPLLLSHTVVEVRGRDRLEEVVVAKVDENFKPIPGTEKIFKVDTLILSVGLIPMTGLVKNLVERSGKGVAVSNAGQTSRDWIFSAGNVTTIFDLVDYVTYEGEIAGKNAALFLKGESIGKVRYKIEPGENVSVVFPRWFDPSEKLTVYLRVSKPIERGRIHVGDALEIDMEDLVPSEMVRIKVPERKIKEGDIKVWVEKF